MKVTLHGAYAELLKIWEKREPITIQTSSGTLENMVMTSLTGTWATFQQIQLVRNHRDVK